MITLQKAISIVSGEDRHNLMSLKAIVSSECPRVIKALQLIDREYTTVKKPKGYNLVKRDNKKLGFVYYVRYWHEGKMLPSKWCTHTNDYEEACVFAEQNRESIIASYNKTNGEEIERFLYNFFSRENHIFKAECKRNREISEDKRKRHQYVMREKLIPFLTARKIRRFTEITVAVLNDFQDVLLASGIKGRTVNDHIFAVKKVMSYLYRKGIIHENPCLRVVPLPIKSEDKKPRGCYEIEKLKGVFDKPWEDKKSLLFNLLIYTTGMRNSEIKSFSKNDIVNISGCHFIDIKKSKTENGIRLVPLHERVYERLMDYADEKDNDEAIFYAKNHHEEKKASSDLGIILGLDEEYLKKNNITFYSGRHAWKTMMNSGRLGDDIEEVFMGHRVSGNVAKLYNHRDKQGKDLLAKKAKKVYKILDTLLFD